MDFTRSRSAIESLQTLAQAGMLTLIDLNWASWVKQVIVSGSSSANQFYFFQVADVGACRYCLHNSLIRKKLCAVTVCVSIRCPRSSGVWTKFYLGRILTGFAQAIASNLCCCFQNVKFQAFYGSAPTVKNQAAVGIVSYTPMGMTEIHIFHALCGTLTDFFEIGQQSPRHNALGINQLC